MTTCYQGRIFFDDIYTGGKSSLVEAVSGVSICTCNVVSVASDSLRLTSSQTTTRICKQFGLLEIMVQIPTGTEQLVRSFIQGCKIDIEPQV